MRSTTMKSNFHPVVAVKGIAFDVGLRMNSLVLFMSKHNQYS